jgi:hypothetical protein
MAVEKKAVPKKSGYNSRKLMVDTGIFLVEILLPALVTGGALYWLAGLVGFWRLDQTIALVVFAILFVTISFIISSFLSNFYKMEKSRRGILMRLVAMAVGGLIVPILIFSGANLIKIAPGQSIMARLIQISVTQPVAAATSQMSTVIIDSKSPFTKVEGIKAINSSHTPADMEQLFILLNSDPADLTNQLVADALSQAIASYGVAAKPGLLAAFQKHAKVGQTDTAKVPDSLYDRYFAQSIAGMQAEINAQAVDAKTKQDLLQQVTDLSNQIKTGLNGVQSQTFQSSQGDPILDVVMDACLQMTITSDGDLLTFAKTTAADASLPEAVRGKALLLVSKLGGKEDLVFLTQYLNNSSEAIKASAFDAITSLNQTLNPPAKTK